MNHTGEISNLTKLIRPHISIITTVEAVHLEFFDSVKAIADAKSEIFEATDKDGYAILNIDNPYFMRIKNNAAKHGIKNVYTFGANEKANFKLVDYKDDGEGMVISAECFGKKMNYKMKVKGKHIAMNSLGVIAVASAAGVNIEEAAKSLAKFDVAKGRGKSFEIKLGDGKITLIDDAYNASPASMRAAFEVLEKKKVAGGRTVAVLGNMLELGKTSPELHAGLAKDLLEHSIDAVFTAGDLMNNLSEALPKNKRAGHAKNSEELTPIVLSALKPNDTILVKGSNGSKMGKIVDAILNLNR